ncbi:protein outspread isoform X2 [Malaya genurostris]|uniref:protein outspread isoform X2 n=1 Tax=Malaya genurostris TaxID=325434 RepID=UPI0026F3DAC6|nr:protein outspread isoform X2 [Malaya genurostris]
MEASDPTTTVEPLQPAFVSRPGPVGGNGDEVFQASNFGKYTFLSDHSIADLFPASSLSPDQRSLGCSATGIMEASDPPATVEPLQPAFVSRPSPVCGSGDEVFQIDFIGKYAPVMDVSSTEILLASSSMAANQSCLSSIRVYYQNVGGMNACIDEYLLACSDECFDVIAFTETWLNDCTLSVQVLGENYEVFRTDRSSSNSTKSTGGGVLVGVHRRLKAQLIQCTSGSCVEQPETIPQAIIDMTKVLEVTTAEDVTSHPHSIAITAPERVTFVKGTCPEESKWWFNVLSAFPKSKGRHKRNATFPGGQATTIIQSQPPSTVRNRHNSYHKELLPSSPVGNLVEVLTAPCSWSPTAALASDENNLNANDENTTIGGCNNNNNSNGSCNVNTKASKCYLLEDVRRDEKLKDIANTITNVNRWSSPCITDSLPMTVTPDDKPTRDENTVPQYSPKTTGQLRPQSLSIPSTAPAIVSAIVKKIPTGILSTKSDLSKSTNANHTTSSPKLRSSQTHERGDPDGDCGLDDAPTNYLAKNSELRVSLPSEELLSSKKGWLMKQDTRTGEWSKHWFSLRGAALFYYRDPVAEEKGVLDGVLDVNSITNITEVPVKKNYGFQLTTWDNRRIVLSTVTISIANNWINVLKNAAGLPQTKVTLNNNNLGLNNQNDDNFDTLTDKQPLEIQIIDGSPVLEKINSHSSNIIGSNRVGVETNRGEDVVDSKPTQKSQDVIIHLTKSNSTSDVINNNVPQKSSSTMTIATTPVTPVTPKSTLFSSDEEYRTASEGGRRDSIGDWGSPLSPSPPVPLSAIARTKDRLRTSHNRLHKRSRSSPPSSRRSTIDSVQSEDIPLINAVQEEVCIDKEVQLRLQAAEKELSMLREETHEREARMSELLATLERTEQELTRKRESEENREKIMMQLDESRNSAQEIIDRITVELDKSREMIKELEDRLARGIEENESLYKKIRDFGICSPASSLCSLSTKIGKMKRMDSFSDLTSLNEVDPSSLDKDMLTDEYHELRARFEKAVSELKAMKREIKESHKMFDDLEISYVTLKKEIDRQQKEHDAQSKMMADRIQDMTNKYTNAEKQVRMLKQKLVRNEKRRSLSLKGKESLSIQKELEEKVAELENKIDVLEHGSILAEAVVSPQESSELKNVKRASARLRRKSLDSATISSQPMQVLLRLNTLEKRVDTIKATANEILSIPSSSESVNSSEHVTSGTSSNSSIVGKNESNANYPKVSEHLMDRLKSLEGVVISVRDLVNQSMHQFQNLKTSRSRRSVSPIADKKDSYKFVERCLSEVSKLLRDSCDNCVIQDFALNNNIVLLPETNPIKLALTQMEGQLKNKLSDLLKQRRMLRETNGLSQRKDMELLAERIAFESVCFGRLRNALERAENVKKYEEKLTKVEVSETIQLMAMLKAKLAGKCGIKPNSSIDVLASVLARKLVLSAGRTSSTRPLNFAPLNSNLLDDLLRQQNEVHMIAKRYKTTVMENLAYGLAAETLSYISSSNDTIQGAVQEAWRQAQEAVNAELVQSEIAHIMMRSAQRYENALTPAFGYALSTNERITFENFADAVQDVLRREMEMAVTQLTECYEESLAKMKRGQWRLHLEQERKPSEGRQLLAEFADIVAHKALIDSRVQILKGDYVPTKIKLIGEDTNSYSVMALKKYENLYTDLTSDLEIANPDDILAEADFNFMYKYFVNEHSSSKVDIKEISNALNELERSVVLLQNTVFPDNVLIASMVDADNLRTVYSRCCEIQKRIESLNLRANELRVQCNECDRLQETLIQITDQHETDIANINQQNDTRVIQLNEKINEQKRLIENIENEKIKLQERLNTEKNELELRKKEFNELSKKLCEYEKLCHEKDKEIEELLENFDEERKKSKILRDKYEELSNNYQRNAEEYCELEKERDYVFDQIQRENDHVKKLERHLEMLEAEHAQQIDNLHAAYREQQMANEIDSQKDKDDEDSLRSRYQAEIEQLRALCEKGLAAMEASHKRIIHDLQEKHQHEISRLIVEKEQALAEETQATLAALDAMRKAHQNEVQREVARFKQEFLKQFQKGGQPPVSYKEKELELEEVRQEILSLSEKYSMKCVETASLEEKLRIASQQLKYSQQHIQQLDVRNKQLRAHFVLGESDEPASSSYTPKGSHQNAHEDVSSVRSFLNSSNSTTSTVQVDSMFSSTTTSTATLISGTNTASVTSSSQPSSGHCVNNHNKEYHIINNKKESHPRLKFCEGAKLNVSTVFPTSISTGIIDPVNMTNSNNRAKVLNPKQPNRQPLCSELTSTSSQPSSINSVHKMNPILSTDSSSSKSSNNNSSSNNNNDTDHLIELKSALKICSPPPLDEKDVEQIHRFELEI